MASMLWILHLQSRQFAQGHMIPNASGVVTVLPAFANMYNVICSSAIHQVSVAGLAAKLTSSPPGKTPKDNVIPPGKKRKLNEDPPDKKGEHTLEPDAEGCLIRANAHSKESGPEPDQSVLWLVSGRPCDS